MVVVLLFKAAGITESCFILKQKAYKVSCYSTFCYSSVRVDATQV